MKTTTTAPRVRMALGGESLVSHAGGALLVETARATGLDRFLSEGLAAWRAPRAVHDPGKVLLDLAVSLCLGGDCLADIAVLRAQPALFGVVASDPTVSRLVDRLAAHPDRALARIRKARAEARKASWAHTCPVAPGQLIVDLDASLVTSHSEKELASSTYKKGFGFHPLLAFADHTPGKDGVRVGGGGEPLAAILRTGKAGANNAADHIAVVGLALAQIPAGRRRNVLVRCDSAGGTKEFLTYLVGRKLAYSVGISVNIGVDRDLLALLPASAWQAAYDSNGKPRDGAQVAELTGLLPQLTANGWPEHMRVIARRERPHPGAQLRLTDVDGWRITLFATSTQTGAQANGGSTQLAALELRHRLRARCEDRIRVLKDLGLTNLPLHDFAQNQVWLETVLLAADLLTWTSTLGLGQHRRAEPKRLRLRLLNVAAHVTTHARQVMLKLPCDWPWAGEIAAGHARLRALPRPA